MNPVTVTIINPRKEDWPSQGSNQQTSVKWLLENGQKVVPIFLSFPTGFKTFLLILC